MSADAVSARRLAAIAQLHRERPRHRFIAWSMIVLGGIVLGSWLSGGFGISGWLTSDRLGHARRFVHELRPWPVRDQAWDWSAVTDWAVGLWRSGGQEAFLGTLAISVVAIVLAGVLGALSSLAAARNFSCPQPLLPGGRLPGRGVELAWRALVLVTRALLVFIRSVPEYVWAFLFLAMLGPTAWPMILALALHNTGILGKLSSEVIENTDAAAPGALRALGASRFQIVLAGIFPLSLPRFLLYFFYRWETCVREATVLGMLGMASLGFWIMDGRARNRYDEMFFFILVGVLLVWTGDLVSALTRRVVRRA